MIIRRNLLILFVLFLFSACGNQNRSHDELVKDWDTYETSEYSIKYPPTWSVNESGYMGTSFLIVSTQTSIRDFYQENISLVEEELSDSIDLQSYVQRTVEMLSDSNSTIRMVENAVQENGQVKFHKLLYGQVEEVNKVIVEKYIFLKNNKIYTLTFSCKGIERKRYMPIGEGMLNSFKLK